MAASTGIWPNPFATAGDRIYKDCLDIVCECECKYECEDEDDATATAAATATVVDRENCRLTLSLVNAACDNAAVAIAAGLANAQLVRAYPRKACDHTDGDTRVCEDCARAAANDARAYLRAGHIAHVSVDVAYTTIVEAHGHVGCLDVRNLISRLRDDVATYIRDSRAAERDDVRRRRDDVLRLRVCCDDVCHLLDAANDARADVCRLRDHVCHLRTGVHRLRDDVCRLRDNVCYAIFGVTAVAVSYFALSRWVLRVGQQR